MYISVFIDYFKKGWYIIVALLITSYLFESWDYLISLNSCFNLTNLFRGKIGNCFSSPKKRCHDLNHGQIYGWCNDARRYGPLIGTSSGPLSGTCENWSWQKSSCPPIQCKSKYPIGIGSQKPLQKWGWCMDTGRAMIGERCGPLTGSCVNWVWDEDKCTNQPVCPAELNRKTTRNEVIKSITESGSGSGSGSESESEVCSNICGNVNGEKVSCPPKCTSGGVRCKNVCGLINGQFIKCPPPDCDKNVDKCICQP